MAANIDTMLYVGEKCWHGLGVRYDTPPNTPEEIIEGASLGWEVDYTKMITDRHESVFNYHAIYRQDNEQILGVVNKAEPLLVQNSQMFTAFEDLIGSAVDTETAASLGKGENVFGCFKIRDMYKVLDDEIDHYFVVVNDHLKADGKVTILNTPIRVVCQNTLSAALESAHHKMRIPITTEKVVNQSIAKNLILSVGNSSNNLQVKADKMVKAKIDKKYVEKVLDVLFPYKLVDGVPIIDKTNEKVSLIREQFLSQCMGADNLANYAGTQWQVFNAVLDWDQHMFKNADKAYDLNYRMRKVPGVLPASETSIVTKFMKVADKLAA